MCGCAGVPNSTLCASYASDFMSEFICTSAMGQAPSKTNCSIAIMLFKWKSCTNFLCTTFSDIYDNPFMQEMTYNWTCLIYFYKQPLKEMY
jgi:hypothetical protein